jgi:hypothetical protein
VFATALQCLIVLFGMGFLHGLVVVRKNSIRLPSDKDVGTYLYCFAALENPRSQPRLAENTSQPGLPYAILTAHVSIPSERKAVTGFSA